MGCFLGCFGSCKDAKRSKQRRRVLPRDQRNASSKLEQPGVSLVQDYYKTVVNPASDVQNKPEEQLSFSPKKKVTFDSNVTTYEPVLADEVEDFPQEKNEETLVKASQSKSSSEDNNSSVTSSGSFPPNHRYQNCRESDDEDEELYYGSSDLSDEDDEEDDDSDEDDEEDDDSDMGESQEHNSEFCDDIEEDGRESSIPISGLNEKELNSIGSNPNARDRSIYVHPVLNPVENVTQWKAIKSKGKSVLLRPQKENIISNQESRIPLSRELSLRSENDQFKNLNQEIAVDASLSNWLSSSETTPVKKTGSGSVSLCGGTIERSNSPSPNSVISHEDRPILGALTVEEMKQFSVSCSQRKSPGRRSPEEMAIIGTVGTYWNHNNTRSKYRDLKLK